jgi:hypothetical protein
MIARASVLPSWRLPQCLWWLTTPLLAQVPGQTPDLMPLPHPEIPPPAVPPAPESWWLLLAGILAAMLLVMLVVWLLFLRKSQASAEGVSPLKLALTRLGALQQELDHFPSYEIAHRVSVILRDYLQARYAVPAPYRTTQELYGERAIQARDGLRERFGPVAEFYDRLEFAPQPATRADSEMLIADALRALRDEKRYAPGALPPPLPKAPPSLPFMPTKM